MHVINVYSSSLHTEKTSTTTTVAEWTQTYKFCRTKTKASVSHSETICTREALSQEAYSIYKPICAVCGISRQFQSENELLEFIAAECQISLDSLVPLRAQQITVAQQQCRHQYDFSVEVSSAQLTISERTRGEAHGVHFQIPIFRCKLCHIAMPLPPSRNDVITALSAASTEKINYLQLLERVFKSTLGIASSETLATLLLPHS
jgi:hypothetical protein